MDIFNPFILRYNNELSENHNYLHYIILDFVSVYGILVIKIYVFFIF